MNTINVQIHREYALSNVPQLLMIYKYYQAKEFNTGCMLNLCDGGECICEAYTVPKGMQEYVLTAIDTRRYGSLCLARTLYLISLLTDEEIMEALL